MSSSMRPSPFPSTMDWNGSSTASPWDVSSTMDWIASSNALSTASSTSASSWNVSSTSDWNVSSTRSSEMIDVHHAMMISFIIVTIFGLIGNILIVVILSQKDVKKLPFTPFLLVMAISDGVTVTIQLLIEGFYWWPFNGSHLACRFPLYIFGVFGGASNWLILVITADRLIAVVFPTWKLSPAFVMDSNLRRYGVIAIVFLGLIIVNVPSCFYVRFDADNSRCLYPSPDETQDYYLAFRIIIVWIPLFTVALGNICIIAVTFWRRRKLSGLNDREKQLVVVLFVISAAYVILELPAGIKPMLADHHLFELRGYPVEKFCCQLNHSINFYLYAIPSGTIRDEIKKMFTPKSRLRAKSKSSASSDINLSDIQTKN